MKKMYFADTRSLYVYGVRIIRENESSVWAHEGDKEKRYYKNSKKGRFFDTELEAWQYLQECETINFINASSIVKQHSANIDTVMQKIKKLND